MQIETVDDLVEDIANGLMVYGSCSEGEKCHGNCRACYTADLKKRIYDAVEIEKRLKEKENA